MKQVILDTETTGLDIQSGNRVIEIGCVEIIDRKFTGREFHTFLNPERAVEPGAFKVHGRSNDFLSDKPIFKDVYKDFLAFINDSELLIHNADFDIGFLNNEFKLSELKININDHIINITDTLGMARQLHPGQRNSLDVLTDRYNIKGYDRSYHGALLDSKILGEVYLAMTGGQTKLNFNEAIEKKELSLKEEFKNNSVTLKKVIVSSEEEKNHQEYLDKIKIEN
ncbi:MAG: DNA polymerase III subunit epsilon [Gammaproteobacteria bacterium]|jgi:DNA polymerase-3 subunit epsilon|nr:MAG: DNA polymerase III subunit epsilon [Gammaproteobacteria bacterium]|tara:strand:- start:3156 stop:3830 length:675 start_codon:yes stop_codon:yes gene_type:complete